MLFKSRPKPDTLTANLDGDLVPVSVRLNARARKLILRFDVETGGAKVTVPPGTSRRRIQKLVEDNTDWLLEQRSARSLNVLGHGDDVTLGGSLYRLQYSDAPPRRVVLHDRDGENILCVGGPADMAPSRLEAWLKKEARQRLTQAAHDHAETLGFSFERISIGDMATRWGSCSSRRTLRFNWRLILAPPQVLDYVAAHEVAHLGEMNHSPAFWALVTACRPDWKQHRQWLRDNGADLMAIRFAGK
ncbi:hypothetical protein GCM10017044_08070 [Kordiimonas sediminis]|uniref:YgjP-like metallopeptidase domain-containing protein n=1 Tax=Kordiimonas sediminis TaxID=1735581 RepID=A0A919E5Y1_9PROT|nr:SprT family zinc-dependent metalloprotease [Kordiimonas sediminis]GHF16183.1 hypothetical protein GCM10017044_08070 [Kordiimonas sediminis]